MSRPTISTFNEAEFKLKPGVLVIVEGNSFIRIDKIFSVTEEYQVLSFSLNEDINRYYYLADYLGIRLAGDIDVTLFNDWIDYVLKI